MKNITYYINDFGDIECEIKENGKKRVTTDFETVESGLIYTSGLKYCTVTELKDKVFLTNKSFTLRINDYDRIMNEVDIQIYENFQKKIEQTRNKVNLQKMARLVVAGGMVLTSLAGIAEIASENIRNASTTASAATMTSGFEPIEIVDFEEPKTYEVSYDHRDEEDYVEDEIIEEEPVVENQTEQAYPDPVITSDNRIYIPDGVRQTGICRDYTCYTTFFNRWNNGTNQRLVADIWDAQGRTSDRGIATINGRYLVAMAVSFGTVGDYVDVVLEDGTVIPCILADAKSPNDSNCTPYGHIKGNGRVSSLEFESIERGQDTIDTNGWQGQAILYAQLYPGRNIFNELEAEQELELDTTDPVTAEDDLTDYEYSDEMIEMVIDELESELDDELSNLSASQEPEPVVIEDELNIDELLDQEPIPEEQEEVVRGRH